MTFFNVLSTPSTSRIFSTAIATLHVSTVPSGEILDAQRGLLDNARHQILGSREERTPEKIKFENDPRVKKVKPPGRCYGIGEMVKQPCATEAPPAAAKVYEGQLDEHQRSQKELLKV